MTSTFNPTYITISSREGSDVWLGHSSSDNTKSKTSSSTTVLFSCCTALPTVHSFKVERKPLTESWHIILLNGIFSFGAKYFMD